MDILRFRYDLGLLICETINSSEQSPRLSWFISSCIRCTAVSNERVTDGSWRQVRASPQIKSTMLCIHVYPVQIMIVHNNNNIVWESKV